MKFSLNLVSRSLAATLAVAALAAPAGAQLQDLRSPDAKGSATLQRPVDVRDAPGYPAVAWQSRATAVRTPAPAQANDDAFDWRSAAIGAAVAAALAFVLFAYRTRPRVAR